MMRRLLCLLGFHRWRGYSLNGGSRIVLRCRDCGAG